MNEFCPTCSGSGGIDVFDYSAGEVVTITCPDCGGSGETMTDDHKRLIKQAERVYKLESDSYNAHLERLLDRREQQNERYRKAIKECLERMDEGGAGTRSFVYEKLIEVLEGEE